LLIFVAVFAFWFIFSTYWITFYRDNNVVSSAPLFIDAARQTRSGKLPFRTWAIGGGGGTDLVGAPYPGVLNPFSLIPAWFTGSDPELMTNVIISLHLALFALGGWFMGTTMRAPPWSSIISGISLGFCGCYAIWVGNWQTDFLPYTFVPWVLAGIVLVCSATSTVGLLVAHLITAISLFCLFYAGSLIGALYSGLAIAACVVSWCINRSVGLKIFALRMLPQGIWFLVAIVPLLWRAGAVYTYGDSGGHDVASYISLSIPWDAYSGLFIPGSATSWKIPWLPLQSFSNFPLSFGAIPAWFILFVFIRKPSLLRAPTIIPLIAGTVLFVVLMSPHELGLSEVFHDTPLLNQFYYPFRAIPAFHVVLLFLFLTMVMTLKNSVNQVLQVFLVVATVFCLLFPLYYDVTLVHAKEKVSSWFRTNDFFSNRAQLKDSSLEKLRRAGYVLSLSRPNDSGPYRWFPALFLHGNMGPQFGISTVHLYIPGYFPQAYRHLGMNGRGQMLDWLKAKRLIEQSPRRPLTEVQQWENGIGPKDVGELTAKTFIGGVIVQTEWREPMRYFLNSPAWKLIERNRFASVFVRTGQPEEQSTGQLKRPATVPHAIARIENND
jgi:hypothetical protein